MSGGPWSTVGPNQPPTSSASWVYVDGYRLMVGRPRNDGSLSTPTPFAMKGVGWSPMPVGEANTSGYSLQYTAFGRQDVPLMASLGANTIKTYSPFELNQNGVALLDRIHASGMMVVMTVMPSYWDAQNEAYLATVRYFKHHPAILMWLVGNELNYNKLYNSALSLDHAVDYVRRAIDEIHAADGEHPVAVSWGNAPDPRSYATLRAADVWSLNLYPYLSMTERFDAWAAMSPKPMFVGEYGADAYDATSGAEDQAKQAYATQVLTEQIQAAASAANPARPVIGGCIFEFADEWFKAPKSSPASQEPGGFTNSGVYPDGVANEEWWGLVTVDRVPRQAYETLKQLYTR